MYILAIESSCDETSLAIVENGKNVIKQVTNTQIEVFKNHGGVIPELASRMHADNIFYVYEELFKDIDITIENIDLIAVTQGPGLMGSLLVGINFAKTLAIEYNIDIVGVNHVHAHIYATNIDDNMKFPHLSLVVSGGHTQLIYMKEHLDFEVIGTTLDDAVGECYDKIGRILGVSYPGGVEIDKLAQQGKDTYDLPYPKNDTSLDFSFSGIKSAAFNLNNTLSMKGEIVDKENFSCSFQNRVMTVLIKKFNLAKDKYKPQQMSIVGGVSANSRLRELKRDTVLIPNLKYTSDNGAMIGVLGYYKYKRDGGCNPMDLDVNLKID